MDQTSKGVNANLSPGVGPSLRSHTHLLTHRSPAHLLAHTYTHTHTHSLSLSTHTHTHTHTHIYIYTYTLSLSSHTHASPPTTHHRMHHARTHTDTGTKAARRRSPTPVWLHYRSIPQPCSSPCSSGACLSGHRTAGHLTGHGAVQGRCGLIGTRALRHDGYKPGDYSCERQLNSNKSRTRSRLPEDRHGSTFYG
jgi:hypothetical protein